ncbi:putative glycosyltransferase EpsD [Spirochaetia bacterium]|nr:putative glycosyltransferase EpsD [Spirochaetia bacterium]
MKKVLFISNHAGFSKFNAPYMRWFKEQGWIVDNISPGIEIADYVDNQIDAPITRNPLSLQNIRAYKIIKNSISKNKYDIIHCHTPVGGILGRLCSIKSRKKGTSVIYTAHGFHFYKGSSLLSWVIYYVIEKILSYYTDCIVTINQEDYLIAQKQFFTKSVFKINGVGVNLERFKPVDDEAKIALRNKYNFEHDDFIVIYVGQFTHDKNHLFLIKQIPFLKRNINNLKVLFVGGGYPLLDRKYKDIIRDGRLQDTVFFMGYRTDIQNLYAISDILISVSKREGMPQNLVEGMACGLPVVCSKIRGHVDIVNPSVNGFFFPLTSPSEMNERLYQLYADKTFRDSIALQNVKDAEKFSLDRSVADMAEIYRHYM